MYLYLSGYVPSLGLLSHSSYTELARPTFNSICCDAFNANTSVSPPLTSNRPAEAVAFHMQSQERSYEETRDLEE